MREQFICEQIKPLEIDISTMAIGEPGTLIRFSWRKTEYTVAQVLRKWKEVGQCRNGGKGAEKYVRKHWYHIRTTDGQEMKIHFERQMRSRSQRIRRWWLYTLFVDDLEDLD